jgi:hypothetical protein
MLESAHRFRTTRPNPVNSKYQYFVDQWFDRWQAEIGENGYLGIPYTFLIADISSEVHANMDLYIADYIHFTEAGAELAAKSIVSQINRCPEGRWRGKEKSLKPDAKYHPNPYLSYGREPNSPESAK